MSLQSKKLFCLVSVLLLVSGDAWAERYSVEEDSFGNIVADKVSAEPGDGSDSADSSSNLNKKLQSSDTDEISVESETISKNAESTSSEIPPISEQVADTVEKVLTTEGGEISDNAQVKQEEVPMPSTLQGTTSQSENSTLQGSGNRILGDTGKKLSSFERAYIEAEEERQKVLGDIKNAPALEEYDATKVDPVDFVDGDDLANGKTSTVKPYYTVVDADGQYKNIFYDPEDLEQAMEALNDTRVQLTPATVVTADSETPVIPERAETKALQLLLGGNVQSAYDRFEELCCASIPNVEAIEVELGKSRYAELATDLLPYRFSEGDSRFALFKLPDIKSVDEFDIALRTFIKEYRREDVENGVFYPQIATLDANRKPVRIFSDLLLSYHEETWLKHGYLEGFFRIKDALDENEKFLLVYTSKNLLKQDTIIATEEGGDFIIKNMNIGAIEVEVLDPFDDRR